MPRLKTNPEHCTNCGRSPAIAKGLCKACHEYHRRTGQDRFSQPMPTRRSPSDQRVLISTTEAAGQLGVDTAKVRRWIERGHLESFRIAGRRRYFVDQLEVDALRVITEEQR